VREDVVDMVMEMKFSINKYPQVFYRGLATFIFINQYVDFPGEDVTLVSLRLSFIQLAMHQPCIALMSD
jgi:hypothetical protein